MVESSVQVPKSTTNAANLLAVAANKKKKKRTNRQRNRPKNKRNRIQNSPHMSDNTIKPNDTTKNTIESIKSINSSAHLQAQTAAIMLRLKTETESQNSIEQTVRDAGIEADVSKTLEAIKADREHKKLAKKANKQKSVDEDLKSSIATIDNSTSAELEIITSTTGDHNINIEIIEKTREQIKAEREARKAAKHAVKVMKSTGGNTEAAKQQLENLKINQVTPASADLVTSNEKKPTLTKAERRAIQEAQRAVKAQTQSEKNQIKKPVNSKAEISAVQSIVTEKPETVSLNKSVSSSPDKLCNKVKLFNHLGSFRKDVGLFINDPLLHPGIVKLGVQYAERVVVGSNARCVAFLNALKSIVQDFETPAKQEFARSFEASIKHQVEYLHKCRPLAVSVTNAYKQFKNQLMQLPTDKPEIELKETLCHFIDTYVENQIGKAALAISYALQEKIVDGDVLLTFGCSSLIHYICEEAKKRNVEFRVIVVDSRPFCEGQELLRRLTAKDIPCTYVLINAISFVMSEATKVLVGAHALLSNGYVMGRTGTAQVALVAQSCNVPVLVCCETHKFSERFQTDAIVYNELGNPNDLVINDKCCLSNWRSKSKMTPLNLNYDITPPELVTAVVTEVSILPCTSVPVILRIKPDIGY